MRFLQRRQVTGSRTLSRQMMQLYLLSQRGATSTDRSIYNSKSACIGIIEMQDARRLELQQAEQQLGITGLLFRRKFLYCPLSASDNYLLDRELPSQSQLQGFSLQQQRGIGYLTSEVIFRAAESLQLPVSTAAVAASLAHFFVSRAGLLGLDFRDLAMGAVFLACKSEETLRKSFEVAAVFDQVFKVFEGQKGPIRGQILNSPEYHYMREKVLEAEKAILFELGFEIHRLLDVPHRYIGGLLKSFERHPEGKRLCQTAWALLNDFYRTPACLHYPPQAIAAAAVYVGLLRLGWKMPSSPWWVLLETSLQIIQDLAVQLQGFYENGSQCTMQWASEQVEEAAAKLSLSNLCPPTYQRKIALDLNGLLPRYAHLRPHTTDLNEHHAQTHHQPTQKELETKQKELLEKQKDLDLNQQDSEAKQKEREVLKEKQGRAKSREREPSDDSDSQVLKQSKNQEEDASPKAAGCRERVRKPLLTAQDLISKISRQVGERKRVEEQREGSGRSSESDSDAQILAELVAKRKLQAERKSQP